MGTKTIDRDNEIIQDEKWRKKQIYIEIRRNKFGTAQYRSI